MQGTMDTNCLVRHKRAIAAQRKVEHLSPLQNSDRWEQFCSVQEFSVMLSATALLGILTFLAVHWFAAPAVSILIGTLLMVLMQMLFLMNYNRQMDSDRKETMRIFNRICKSNPSIQSKNASFSTIMQEIEGLYRDTLRKERKVVENAADLICLVSTEGTILSANPAAKAVLGYTPEELVGKQLSDLRAISSEENLSQFLGADESIQKISLENQFRRKDGSIIDLLWSAHWSARDNGLFCIAHDITARKTGERLLKESEERIRLILESLPAGVCVLGAQGEVKFINKTARQLCLNTQNANWNGQADQIFKPCTYPFSLNEFSASIATEQPVVLNSNSEEIPVEITLRTINWEDSPACLVMFVDISEKLAAERARHEFISFKQQLIDMVVHDIRGPLQTMLSAHELILLGCTGQIETKTRTKLSMCNDEAKRVIRLLNDLLKISRNEATKLNSTMRKADMAHLIDLAVGSIRDFAGKQSVDISTDTTSADINADSDRILQVLFNLLSNATKFSPENSSIKVSASIENGAVLVSVADEGIGIPAGAEDSIFLPYSQVSWKDSAEKGGTGLGLSICKQIVEEHGGSIGVTNNKNGGAKFWFSIPVANQTIL